MTKTSQHATADVFTAIAHPLRRRMLDLLIEGEQPVGQLAEAFDISRPAVSQHLRILLEAGLVAEERHGRQNRYRLEADRLQEVQEWVSHYTLFWTSRLAALDTYLKETHE